MADQIRVRRDITADWAAANPILAEGEPGLDLTTGILKFGNGSSHWLDLPGLPYALPGAPIADQVAAILADTTSAAAIALAAKFAEKPALLQFGSPMLANAYYTTIHGGTSTVLNAEGLFRGGRLVVGRDCTLVQIGLDVTVAGSAGALLRLGIYKLTSPAAATLILDAGTVDATTTGLKLVTINQAVKQGDNLLIGAAPQGGATTRATVRSNSGADPYFGDLNINTVNINVISGAGSAGVAGALPSSLALAVGGSGSIPRTIVRVAP